MARRALILSLGAVALFAGGIGVGLYVLGGDPEPAAPVGEWRQLEDDAWVGSIAGSATLEQVGAAVTAHCAGQAECLVYLWPEDAPDEPIIPGEAYAAVDYAYQHSVSASVDAARWDCGRWPGKAEEDCLGQGAGFLGN